MHHTPLTRIVLSSFITCSVLFASTIIGHAEEHDLSDLLLHSEVNPNGRLRYDIYARELSTEQRTSAEARIARGDRIELECGMYGYDCYYDIVDIRKNSIIRTLNIGRSEEAVPTIWKTSQMIHRHERFGDACGGSGSENYLNAYSGISQSLYSYYVHGCDEHTHLRISFGSGQQYLLETATRGGATTFSAYAGTASEVEVWFNEGSAPSSIPFWRLGVGEAYWDFAPTRFGVHMALVDADGKKGYYYLDALSGVVTPSSKEAMAAAESVVTDGIAYPATE